MNMGQEIKDIPPLIIGDENKKQNPFFWIAPLLGGGFKFNYKFWIGKEK